MRRLVKGLMTKERGFSLVEVLVGLSILAIVAAGFLMAIATAYKANIISNERTNADSLARTQMESIKAADYELATAGGQEVYLKIPVPDGWEIWSVRIVDNEEVIDEDAILIIAIPWDSQNGIPTPTDAGLQKIKLVIVHNGNEVLWLEEYKEDR